MIEIETATVIVIVIVTGTETETIGTAMTGAGTMIDETVDAPVRGNDGTATDESLLLHD